MLLGNDEFNKGLTIGVGIGIVAMLIAGKMGGLL
jgi:hypothetical protein